jgi:hypothetical protein
VDETAKGQAPAAEAPTETAPADAASTLSAAMEAMRSLLQRTGGALAAAGGVVLAGLGYSQLHKLFPIPSYGLGWWLLAVAAGGLLLAVVGAGLLAAIYMRAQRRILMETRVEDCDLDRRGGFLYRRRDAEPRLVTRHFLKVAAENDAADLHQLELRAARLSRIALRIPDRSDARRIELEQQVADLQSTIQLGLRQAAALVLERRSANAFRRRAAALPLLCAIAGVLLAFGAADYSQGERDKIGVISSCGTVAHSEAGWCPTSSSSSGSSSTASTPPSTTTTRTTISTDGSGGVVTTVTKTVSP